MSASVLLFTSCTKPFTPEMPQKRKCLLAMLQRKASTQYAVGPVVQSIASSIKPLVEDKFSLTVLKTKWPYYF